MSTNTVSMGVDIGQRRDPTAIAVAELEGREREPARPYTILGSGEVLQARPAKVEEHYLIRHLERLPLGTAYPAVVARVVDVTLGVLGRIGQSPHAVYVDATGVGQPVVDLLKDAGVSHLWACYFTHGDRRTHSGTRQYSVGKAWLVSRLQALLQTGCLHLPRTAEADALSRELLDYEIKIDQDANDTYGAFKVGTHDDLVTALGLAVQPVRRMVPY